jgi:hypothetical protein
MASSPVNFQKDSPEAAGIEVIFAIDAEEIGACVGFYGATKKRMLFPLLGDLSSAASSGKPKYSLAQKREVQTARG